MSKKVFFFNGLKSIYLLDDVVKITLNNSTPNEIDSDEIELICTFNQFKTLSNYLNTEKLKMIDLLDQGPKKANLKKEIEVKNNKKKIILSSIKDS